MRWDRLPKASNQPGPGGGSVVGLPKVGREQECVRSVAHAGGLAFIVPAGCEGAQLIGAPS